MNCSNCGTENSERVKFCAECGSPLGVPCPHCNFRNPRGVAACGGCGKSLDGGHNEIAERRHITVFFADIAGSTALAESLDPEDLRDLYAQYQEICAGVVHHYEGHLAQYLGDGVLAYFGYPRAHEDDAPRAVRSGLEILKRLESISIGGTRPHVRIGIHTGLVVVGDIGSTGRREQLALGEAPNIAARLQSEAVPDTIVISDDTRRLIGGQFALSELGSRTLKGISRPMQLFTVRGFSEASSRFQAMSAVSGLVPFVGRVREVGLIREAWAKAADGHGQLILLRGEAGIGKSRLLEAAKQGAGNRLHEVFEAQCSPYQMQSPLSPIIELLGRRMGLEPGMPIPDKLDLIEQFAAGRGVNLESAAMAVAELLSVPVGSRYPRLDIPPAKFQQWMIETLAELLSRSVGGSPVLLLFEDLHWADPSTLDLVGEMLARLENLPVMVVCTARPEFTAPWTGDPRCQDIHVEALPPEDTRGLVASVAGRKALPLALIEELVARTSGIPLFVEAVTRSVIEAGILRELDDRFELTGPLPPGLIPTTLQASLMGRIDRLGQNRSVAQLAATIGREFSFELLHGVSGQPVAELTKVLRQMVDLELVSEMGVPPSSTYSFKHALIQDAAYESLLRKTRQKFHNEIAEALQARFPEMAESKPELLARHYEGAGRIDEATAGWKKAGLLAGQRFAVRESVAHLRKAISLLETLPGDDPSRLRSEMEAQLALFPALMSTLGWGSREVEAACVRAQELCEKLGNFQGLLGSRWGLWTVYLLRGTIVPCIEAAKPVLEMAMPTGDPMLQIIAHQANGYSNYFIANFAAAREHAENALALYDPERERTLVSIFQLPASFACGNFLTMSLWFTGYPEQAERARKEAWAVIESLDIPACTAYALGNSMMIHYARRDREAIAAQAEQLYTVSVEGGFLLWAAQARIYRGWAWAMNGDTESGIAEMNAGMKAYRLTGSGIMMPQLFLMLAEAYWRAGRPGEALGAISSGLRHSSEHDEYVFSPELYRLRGDIQLAQGAAATGEASYRRSIEVAQAQKARMLELQAAIALAKVQLDSGRLQDAHAMLLPLYEWFQEGHDTPELVECRALLTVIGAQRATAT